MPLIEVRYNANTVHPMDIARAISVLPLEASTRLSCEEGGKLSEKDIMIEVQTFGLLDKHCKDIHIRVWAHDYPSRKERLEEIQSLILSRVRCAIGDTYDMYVWVLLCPTAYGSIDAIK
ncbi:MAG: hypothetical protein RLZZ480_351 [Candidatus Parcubacteria bacterium]|jgi:hypothetical protein